MAQITFDPDVVKAAVQEITDSVDTINGATKNYIEEVKNANAKMEGNNPLIMTLQRSMEKECASIDELAKAITELGELLTQYQRQVEAAASDDDLRI